MVDWLKGYISDKCPYCGAEMVETINDDGKITNRYCSNIKKCPGHNAMKVVDMMNILGIKSIGFKTALENIKRHKFISHVEYLSIIPKQKVEFSTCLRLLCVDGVDKQFVKECETKGIYSIDDMHKLSPKLLAAIQTRMPELCYVLAMVDLVEHHEDEQCDVIVTVMITGPVKGYRSKEEFIEYCNAKYKGKIKVIHQETKRKTGVDFLIKEEYTGSTGKVETARSAGIPIVTSEFFLQSLEEVCKQL